MVRVQILLFLMGLPWNNQYLLMEEEPPVVPLPLASLPPLVLGYYPFRAKGQVPRLICEYLHLPYCDRFFTPDEWSLFKETQTEGWVLRDLPFLQDGDFVVTGPIGIVTYLLEKAGRTDLLGRTLIDQAKLDSIRSRCDLRTAIVAMTCVGRSSCEGGRKEAMAHHWEKKIAPLLTLYEQECQLAPWFFPYQTIMDFVTYEAINQLERIFPQETAKFTKLRALRHKVALIPEIAAYEDSERAVKEYCPMRYFASFKEEKIRRSRGSSGSSTSSRSSRRDMQEEP